MSFEFVLAFFDYFLLLLLHFIFILEVSRIGKEPVFTAGQWGVKFKAFGFEIVKTKTSMFEAKVGSDRVGRSQSIGKRSSPGSIKMVCAPIDRRFIVDRSRSTISKRDGISVARRGGRRTSPSLSSSLLLTRRNFRHEERGRRTSPPSLSSSLPLTRRNFRHEERREENFSFFVSLSLSLARPCVARGVLHHPLLSFRWRSP